MLRENSTTSANISQNGLSDSKFFIKFSLSRFVGLVDTGAVDSIDVAEVRAESSEKSGLFVDADLVLATDAENERTDGSVVTAVDLREEMVDHLEVEAHTEIAPEGMMDTPVQRGGHLREEEMKKPLRRLPYVTW